MLTENLRFELALVTFEPKEPGTRGATQQRARTCYLALHNVQKSAPKYTKIRSEVGVYLKLLVSSTGPPETRRSKSVADIFLVILNEEASTAADAVQPRPCGAARVAQRCAHARSSDHSLTPLLYAPASLRSLRPTAV